MVSKTIIRIIFCTKIAANFILVRAEKGKRLIIKKGMDYSPLGWGGGILNMYANDVPLGKFTNQIFSINIYALNIH